MDKTNVNKDRVRLLVEALRSGEFVQGHSKLKQVRPDGSERYCCLGVACVVALRNGLDLDEEVVANDVDGEFSYFGRQDDASAMFMPQSVMSWYGFAGANAIELDPPSSLPDSTYSAVDLNDTYEFNFEKIADAFEDTFLVGEK